MSNSCLMHIENYWKIKTSKANQLFNEGNYNQALLDYKDAMYRAEVLSSNTEVCKGVGIPFIQVYTISCNNLANTYQELGELEKAIKILKRSVYHLIYLAKKNLTQIEEIKSELKRAITYYYNFTKSVDEHIEEEEFMKILKKNLLSA